MDTGVIPDTLLEEAARRFALLGDPTRLRILRTLHETGETAVGDLAEMTGITRSNASQHLGMLAAAGLVGRRRERSAVHYRIADETLGQLCDLVCTSLRARAQALAAS